MRVVDVINQAVAKVGIGKPNEIDSDLYSLALGFLNRVYEEVWNIYPFRDERLVALAVTTTAGEDLVMPEEVDQIRATRTSTLSIFPFNEVILNAFSPSAFRDTGDSPSHFFNLPDSPVTAQPAAAARLQAGFLPEDSRRGAQERGLSM